MDGRYNRVLESAEYIKALAGGRVPEVGIVLGSGLGRLADSIGDAVTIPYRDIPGFPLSTAAGHKGNFIIGQLGGKCVIAMQGRFHYYEGYDMEKLSLSIRTMNILGIRYLFVSNAAGSCNPDIKRGDLMVIRDHINTLPNPLIGPNMNEMGTRFPDMTCAYDAELRDAAFGVAAEMGINLKQGVYFATSGPSYETPAEVRFFRTVGADAIGMSTVPEVIVARHCGIRVFGVSVITNESNTDNIATNLNDGDDVVREADIAAVRMTELFTRIISRLPQSGSRG
ncbi:MAG: purine-nucleoside phosphorylase [Bacteroidales bacterium]|nr:purine-nucleoside phosphorylase [Bacteroidales bacterium]